MIVEAYDHFQDRIKICTLHFIHGCGNEQSCIPKKLCFLVFGLKSDLEWWYGGADSVVWFVCGALLRRCDLWCEELWLGGPGRVCMWRTLASL